MVGLKLKFRDEAHLLSFVETLKGLEAVPFRASVREEDALDKTSKDYVLDGGRDGGSPLRETTTTTTTYTTEKN